MFVQDIFLFPISVVAKCFILLFGWHLLDDVVLNKLTKYNRSVLIFSHTSYVDFYIFIIYLLAYKRYLQIRTLIKPQPFEYAGLLLRSLGGIPSTKIEDSNGGAVKRICSELEQSNNFGFLICPKGTILNKPWKKGYYHIAKTLNAKLMVTGFDYEEKRIVVLDDYSCEEYDEHDICELLQKDIGKIVPLFPDCEVVPIRQHNEDQRGIFNYSWLLSVIGTLIFLYNIFIH